MKVINVVLEQTKTGYSAYSDDVPGCIAVGESLSKVKENMKSAINTHIETLIEFDEELPLKFKDDKPMKYRFTESLAHN